MTFLGAAEEVLRKSRKPLTVREITERALKQGLVHTKGKTPEATMSAALYGAPADAPLRREFTAGRQRAKRDSVRWLYDPGAKPASSSSGDPGAKPATRSSG